MSSENTIEDWRVKIDAIDRQILELLSDRARCVLGVGKIKGQKNMTVFDPKREQQIIESILSNNKGPLDNSGLQRIFERVIEECRRIEVETHGG